MGGGLTLGLAPKHKLQKKATQKRDTIGLPATHMQAVAGQLYILSILRQWY
jgi:hypothetical protein